MAHARGYRALHVLHRNLQGTSDRGLMRLVRSEGLILVTSNRKDFLALYRQEALHPGLVIIVPGNLREDEQIRYFGLALETVAKAGDMVNKLLEVHAGGSVTIVDWPPA